jgi:hypothetical protein
MPALRAPAELPEPRVHRERRRIHRRVGGHPARLRAVPGALAVAEGRRPGRRHQPGIRARNGRDLRMAEQRRPAPARGPLRGRGRVRSPDDGHRLRGRLERVRGRPLPPVLAGLLGAAVVPPVWGRDLVPRRLLAPVGPRAALGGAQLQRRWRAVAAPGARPHAELRRPAARGLPDPRRHQEQLREVAREVARGR